VVIPEPEYTQEVQDIHQDWLLRRATQELRLSRARETKRDALKKVVEDGDVDAPMLLAILENEIEEALYATGKGLAVKMTESEKTHHDNEWRTYRERKSRLEKQ
jgi:hypothetical protein